MDTTETVPAASLLLDENLYPRHKVDATHVTHIRSAMRAGEDLPPVVACRKTRKVADGFHRITAALKENGETAEVCVQWEDYESDAALLAEAIRLNSGHGSNLSRYDRVRCMQLADEYKISSDDLASALRMTPEELAGLKLTRTARVGGKITPIKHGLGHLAGRRLTRRQADGVERYGGMTQVYFVNQVVHLIEDDLLDTQNEGLIERLIYLRGLLEGIEGA